MAVRPVSEPPGLHQFETGMPLCNLGPACPWHAGPTDSLLKEDATMKGAMAFRVSAISD